MLFCFDFDNTIINEHFNNLLVSHKQKPDTVNLELVAELVDKHGFIHHEETKEVIQSALHNGHQVAIVSYNQFPRIYETVFKKMGLSDEEFNAINIISYLPADQSIGKLEHLRKAMKDAEITDKNQVYLIDDSRANYLLAQREGYNVAFVPVDHTPPPIYLHQLKDIAQNKNISNNITRDIPSEETKESVIYTESRYVDLSNVMMDIQNLAGRNAASDVKQAVFRKLQADELAPEGDDTRTMPEYMSGKTAIQASRPLTETKMNSYLNYANEVAKDIKSMYVDLNSIMISIQNLAGGDKASKVKQDVFKKLQADGLAPASENIRIMPEYMSGKTTIQTSRPLTETEMSRYLNYANKVAKDIKSTYVDLSNVMMDIQTLAGSDAASKVKQAVFRKLQADELAPEGANIRTMTEYMSGKTAIQASRPLTATEMNIYLSYANEVANSIESSKTTSMTR